MAYQEQQQHRSRVVVETPSAKREVDRVETVRYPERDGAFGMAMAAVVVGIIALAAIIILFVMNRQQQQDQTANTPQPQTTIVQQPAQQPPVVVQQPAPATQPAPVIVNQPSGGSTSGGVRDDSAIQAAIDKKLSSDPNLSSLGIYVNFANGKATLTGTVKTESQKAQVERAVRSVKGVNLIDNQIIVG
jgi:uncharacterized protein HemX